MISPTVPIDPARHSEMIWPTIPVILPQIFIEQEDQYDTALVDLLITAKERSRRERRRSNWTLSVRASEAAAGQGEVFKAASKAAAGQKEMLLPIAGEKPAKAAANKPAARQRKST
jgi:DNA end-binding protein Ku